MARVFKAQWANDENGKRRYSSKHYVEYRNHRGELKREPAYRDKGLSQQHLADILRREELIKAGKLQPADSGEVLGIVELLDRWRQHMERKGCGASHVKYYHFAADRVCTACRFDDPRSIDASKAQRFLESLVAAGKSNATYNWYRAACMAFGNWLADKERATPANPFRGIDSRNPDLNPSYTRRALTDAEFKRLLEATKKGATVRGLTGEQRYYLYLVAAYSGLRFAALVALTTADFDSDSVTSSVRLQKNRRAHTVPLPPDVAAKLRRWFRGKAPDVLLWPIKSRNRKGSEMIQIDLAAAKIPFRTDAGQFDFHALRGLYASMLVRSGASLLDAQKLLDHASPATTAKHYIRVQMQELRKPVGRLPRV